ncbi:MAG: ribonuclease HI [Syntrophomonadaceae bacterium]|nr:ribonuclease HI [Syntrophomonadaceae bacterium]
MQTITIYTDGACSGNPGPGGWGAVLMAGQHRKEASGGEAMTTNQRMELTAVIEALKLLKVTGHPVKVYSDSAYVVNAFNQHWIENWRRNGWINSKKDPVANRELWEDLWGLTRKNEVTFHKVKGHAGDEHNERCDFLARQGLKEHGGERGD